MGRPLMVATRKRLCCVSLQLGSVYKEFLPKPRFVMCGCRVCVGSGMFVGYGCIGVCL